MKFKDVAPLLLVAVLLTGTLDLQAEFQENETTITVDSTNFRFTPASVTISEGETVRFLWNGELLPHNAVETNGLFDSGEPSRNVDYSFIFEVGSNGTYEYVCEPHEDMGMVGTIVVEPVNITDEEEPVVEADPIEDRGLPAPLLTGILSLLLASVLPKGSLSRRGERDE